jgi:hypothetical protein
MFDREEGAARVEMEKRGNRRRPSAYIEDSDLRYCFGEIETSIFETSGIASSVLLRPGQKRFDILQTALRIVALLNVIIDTYLLAFPDDAISLRNVWWNVCGGVGYSVVVVLDIIYLVGFVLRFRTSVIYMNTMTECFHREDIMWFHIRSFNFYADMISFLGAGGAFLWNSRWLLIFHVLRAWRLPCVTEQAGAQMLRRPDSVKILELTSGVWIFGHIFGCIWFTVLYQVEGEKIYSGKKGPERYIMALRDGMMILTESGHRVSHQDDWRIAFLVVVLRPVGAIFLAYVFAKLVVAL